jgi:hypothetical protein
MASSSSSEEDPGHNQINDALADLDYTPGSPVAPFAGPLAALDGALAECKKPVSFARASTCCYDLIPLAVNGDDGGDAVNKDKAQIHLWSCLARLSPHAGLILSDSRPLVATAMAHIIRGGAPDARLPSVLTVLSWCNSNTAQTAMGDSKEFVATLKTLVARQAFVASAAAVIACMCRSNVRNAELFGREGLQRLLEQVSTGLIPARRDVFEGALQAFQHVNGLASLAEQGVFWHLLHRHLATLLVACRTAADANPTP